MEKTVFLALRLLIGQWIFSLCVEGVVFPFALSSKTVQRSEFWVSYLIAKDSIPKC